MQFGRYELGHRLGVGGMAEVFFARELGPRGFSRTVAIKRVLPEFANQQEFIDMLVAEARVSAALQHPVIVQVLDFGEIDGTCYLALELVEGFNLRQLLLSCRDRNRTMPPGLACHIVAQVASALAYAHARTDTEGRSLRIVHRDISLSNVMLSPAGAVKLLDFGIAKAANFVRDEQTRTGMLKGKVSYMSPEQAAMRPVDKRSDIFSLGVVFYELLVAKRLFKGESDAQSLDLVRRAVVVPPSQQVPDLPPEIDAIIAKMLAVKPEERYQDCSELAALLEPIAHRLGAGQAELQRFVAEVAPPPTADTIATKSERIREGSTDELATLVQSPATRSSTLSGRATAPGAPGWTWWLIGLTALGTLGLIVGSGVGSGQPTPEPALPASGGNGTASRLTGGAATDLAAVAAPLPPASSQVRLRVSGTEQAEVSVDGALMGTVPLDLVLPRVSGTRMLVVERPGFRRYAHKIAAGFDVTLRIDLSPAVRLSHH